MKTLLILCGGRSEEHEISLISAKCILDAVDRTKLQPIVIGVSKQGVWHLEEEKTFFLGEVRADKIRLNENAPTVTLAPFPSRGGRGLLLADGKKVEFDAVFPIIHGTYGEDGRLQGLLDMLGVPYVGAGCGSSWNCMDKVVTKILCEAAGITMADYVCVESERDLEKKSAAVNALGLPLFVKPSRSGSSVGVSKVTDRGQLDAAVKEALRHDTKVLIEKGINGREIECAVLGNHGSAKASLPGEIVVSKKIGWYSYEAKYLLKDGAETLAPAPLDEKITQAVRDFSLQIYHVMECDGLARVDLFLEQGTNRLFLNEVNTLPGFTPISMYPKMWQATGLAYPELINELVRLAFTRLGRSM